MARRTDNFHNVRFAAGEGAGLVKGDRAQAADLLEELSAPDQHSTPGGGRQSAHHGDGGRDHEGTWAGDDQHDQSATQPLAPAALQVNWPSEPVARAASGGTSMINIASPMTSGVYTAANREIRRSIGARPA